MKIALTVFRGRAADPNALGVAGARSLGAALSQRLGLEAIGLGDSRTPPHRASWAADLETAMPCLRELQKHFDQLLSQGCRSVAAINRCAAALATLPTIIKYYKNACVVWFDAHGDLNTPASSLSGFLGGMALSGPLGLWDAGLGAGLRFADLVLVGQRDLDPFEAELIRSEGISLIPPDSDFSLLSDAIAGRPVYVHLDCDVLRPGIVPTKYKGRDGGLSLADLRNAAQAIAASEVLGIEIAEFEGAWTPAGDSASPTPLLDALQPILDRMSA